MSQLIYTSSLGVEDFLDDVKTVVIRDINDALKAIYERRSELDKANAVKWGVEYVPLEYDEVDPANVFVANFPRKSLEEVEKETYPYIVLTVEDYAPDPEDSRNDQVNVYRDGLSVHCLAQASVDEGSEVVFRRAIRMAEAVYVVLMSDSVMKRRLSSVSNPQRGTPSVPFTHKFKGRGDDFWFQAYGTFYAVKTYMANLDHA